MHVECAAIDSSSLQLSLCCSCVSPVLNCINGTVISLADSEAAKGAERSTPQQRRIKRSRGLGQIRVRGL